MEESDEWEFYKIRFDRDDAKLTVRSVIGKAGDLAFPQLVYYVPADEQTRKWYAEMLGLGNAGEPNIINFMEQDESQSPNKKKERDDF